LRVGIMKMGWEDAKRQMRKMNNDRCHFCDRQAVTEIGRVFVCKNHI